MDTKHLKPDRRDMRHNDAKMNFDHCNEPHGAAKSYDIGDTSGT